MTIGDLSKVHVIELPELESVSGIYFLMQDEQVVYVGQSTNVYQRIIQHKEMKKIPFSHALWYEVAPPDLISVEYYWISRLRPPHNNGNKARINSELAEWTNGLLTSDLISKIEELEREINRQLSTCYQQVAARSYKTRNGTLAQDIADLRQNLYDGLRELELPIRVAHKLVERFFGWSAWETSMTSNGEKQPSEKERSKRKELAS
jgi:hypothetical protein